MYYLQQYFLNKSVILFQEKVIFRVRDWKKLTDLINPPKGENALSLTGTNNGDVRNP